MLLIRVWRFWCWFGLTLAALAFVGDHVGVLNPCPYSNPSISEILSCTGDSIASIGDLRPGDATLGLGDIGTGAITLLVLGTFGYLVWRACKTLADHLKSYRKWKAERRNFDARP